MFEPGPHRPVIIIGAGRSGTKLLRDLLCDLDGFHTWPCDELNYVWRSGNRNYPTDQFQPTQATAKVQHDLRAVFRKRAAKNPQARIVEKTCANSLRVGFVDAILPDAQFVQIVRDGRDVTLSAMERWTAGLDIPYIAKKARFVPPRELPYYSFRYLKTRIARLRSDEDRLSWWGPRFDGMEALTTETPLSIIAARQWEACVRRSHEQLANIDPARKHTIVYRDLALAPGRELRRLVDFLGYDCTAAQLERVSAQVRADAQGRWIDALPAQDQKLIKPIVDGVHATFGIRTEA